MSLFTENLQILTNMSKKIDKTTANTKDLATVESLIKIFIEQSEAGYYNEVERNILIYTAQHEADEIREIIRINADIKKISKEIDKARRKEAKTA